MPKNMQDKNIDVMSMVPLTAIPYASVKFAELLKMPIVSSTKISKNALTDGI